MVPFVLPYSLGGNTMRLISKRVAKWAPSSLPVLNDIFDKIRFMFISKIELQDNFWCDFVSFTSSGGPGTAHTVSHVLRKEPTGFFIYSTISGTSYLSGAPAWTSDSITFTQSFSGVTNPVSPGVGDEVKIMVF